MGQQGRQKMKALKVIGWILLIWGILQTLWQGLWLVRNNFNFSALAQGYGTLGIIFTIFLLIIGLVLIIMNKSSQNQQVPQAQTF